MIIKNGNVFQEDGSFCRETLYIRNHRLTEAFEETSEEEVIDEEEQNQLYAMQEGVNDLLEHMS